MSGDQIKEAARQLIETSCQAQGLKKTITDPVAVGQVAKLLRTPPDPAARRGSSR